MSTEPVPPPPSPSFQPPAGGGYRSEKKLPAALLGIFLGGFGAHKFFLGYQKEAIIQLVATFVTCGAAHLFGLIEGIIYLTKTDEEFDRTYVTGRKPWL